MIMKKLSINKLYCLFLLCILLLSGCSDTHDVYGHSIRFKNYKGKWLVINYFAPWCKPCLKEMPELNYLYLLYKSRLMVFGVSYENLSNAEIIAFANKTGITFPLLHSFPLEKYTNAQIEAIPTTFLISPDGKLAKVLQGPQTLADLEKAIGFDTKQENRIEFRVLHKPM